MEYKRTRSGRLFNDGHAQCLYPDPETHLPGAILPRENYNRHPGAFVRNYCRDCVSLENKHHRQRKKLAGECAVCKLPALFGVFCEWHWFRNTAAQATRLDRRAGMQNDTDRDELARHIQSIYPGDESCSYCGATMIRAGGSVKDGIKNSHQGNARSS